MAFLYWLMFFAGLVSVVVMQAPIVLKARGTAVSDETLFKMGLYGFLGASVTLIPLMLMGVIAFLEAFPPGYRLSL